MREGRRSLSGSLSWLSCGALRYMPTLKRQSTRRSRDCVTAARSMSSRSIRSSRSRASRERWSSSTLGTLRLQKLVRSMAPSISRMPPSAAGRPGAAPRIARRLAKMCELPHIIRRFNLGADLPRQKPGPRSLVGNTPVIRRADQLNTSCVPGRIGGPVLALC
jgi:hypothetical protein